jgi:hypothetical protein
MRPNHNPEVGHEVRGKPKLLLVAGHQAGQVEGGQAAQHREADRGQQPAGGEQPRPDPTREQDPPRARPQRPGASEGHQVLQDRAGRHAADQAAEQVQQLDVEREADHQGQRAPGGPQPDRWQPPGQLVATLQGPREAGRGEQGEDDTQDADRGSRRWRRGDRRLQRRHLAAAQAELAGQDPRGTVTARVGADGADHDEQGQDGAEGLGGEDDRAVEELDLDETAEDPPGEAALGEAHGRLDAAPEVGHSPGLVHAHLRPWLRTRVGAPPPSGDRTDKTQRITRNG